MTKEILILSHIIWMGFAVYLTMTINFLIAGDPLMALYLIFSTLLILFIAPSMNKLLGKE